MPLAPPSLSFDPTDDFLIFDNLETVAYATRSAGEVFTDPYVPCLVRHGAVEEPDESGFERQTFHIRPADITFTPKPRDEIFRSDGTMWVVNDVNLETFGTRYRLSATRSRAAFAFLEDNNGVGLLDNTGGILSAV